MATLDALDTDSEDELPAGWVERVAANGRVYYASHVCESTQWEHPTSGRLKTVSEELPYGWEKKIDEAEEMYFVDHINKRTTYTDPRLAFAEPTALKPNPVTKRGEVKQRFDANSTALQVLLGRDLSNHYVVITGGNSGIGFETARSLALHGAHVVLACRNLSKAAAAVKVIQNERPQAKVVAMFIDLASLTTVKQFVQEYLRKNWPLQILVLNAGVFGLTYTQTDDGYEAVFQTNYLGHYYLAVLLQDLLCKSAPSRVVTVSAESHRFTDLTSSVLTRIFLSPPEEFYTPILAYNTSKLCCILLSMELHRRLSPHGVVCNAVHPGNLVYTEIPRHSWFLSLLFAVVRPFTKSKQQAAATTVYCATARELHNVSGYYFNHCFQCTASEEAQNKNTASQLWEISEVMVAQAKSLNGYPFI